MSVFICAQLSADDIVVTVARLAHAVEGPHIIPVETYDDAILGMRYDRQTGQFVPVQPDTEDEALGQ